MGEKVFIKMHIPAVLCMAAAVVCGISGQPVKPPQGGSVVGAHCRRAEIPKHRPHGTNRLSGGHRSPVYQLSLRNDGQHHYTVSVQLGNRLLPFSDAFISAETNGSCGVGEFFYEDSDFYRVVQPPLDCPLLLTTNRKSVMQGLPPLRWKAPSCGCVRFRAMVIEASTVYYAEQGNTAEGPLATTICFSKPIHTQRELTKEERTDILCQVTERNSGLSVIQRPRFLHNHRLEPRYMNSRVIDLALTARRHDIGVCCVKKDEERQACLADVHRRRVDGLCGEGVPDIPFTVLRAAFMRQREQQCCWRLGRSRYSCFSAQAELKSARRSVDFSLDEADPLNDLADYDEELVSLEKEHGTIFLVRAGTSAPSSSSSSSPSFPTTTTPTPTPPATTTTTTTTTPLSPPSQPPLPPLLSPRQVSSQLSPSLSQRSHRPRTLQQQVVERGGEERRGGGVGGIGVRRAGGMDRGGEVEVEEKEEASLASLEIGEQGGRSIDKTFAALQRRMWKLSVKTRCCQAGVNAANAAYGNFNAVWSQCTDSAAKYMTGQRLRQGHKMCSSQFHRCCMEMSISLPPEVVTMPPDSASSREWDRDRHLVHSVYLPPHARGSPHPDLTSRQRHADVSPSRGKTSAERRRGLLKAKVTRPPVPPPRSRASRLHSLLIDEPEIDEEPQNKRSRPYRRPAPHKRVISRSRQMDLGEDLGSRRQRRLRKQNSRERQKAGRRSRERQERVRASSRRRVEDAEREAEGAPVLKKRRLSSGGRSKEARDRHGQRRANSRPVEKEQVGEEEGVQKENPAPQKVHHQMSKAHSKAHPVASKGNSQAEKAAAMREMRHELEAEQLRKLFAEIAEDVEDEEEEEEGEEEDLTDEEADNGSEENPDSLGLAESDDEVANDEGDDEDDQADDRSDEDFVEDNEVNENNQPENVEQEKPASAQQDSKTLAVKQQSEERKPQPPHTTTPITPAEKREREVTPQEHRSVTTTEEPTTVRQEADPVPTSPASPRRASQKLLPASHRRRSRLLRLRSRGALSEEDGHSRHSGGRSTRRKRKFHHGRRRYRNLRHFKRRPRVRWNRQELSEALEEE